MVFIAGSMYNETSNDDDFWVGGFLPNGSKIQQFHYNGLGSQQDSAWAVCAGPLLVATGYIVDKETFPGPPPYVQFNRNIYTLRLELQNLPPDVNFSWSPTQAETGEKITFTDHSLDPDGTIAAWRWDFGDGKLAVLEAPTHSYEDSGTYAVTLTVTDDDGEERSLTKNIEVVSAGNGGIPGFELALMLVAAALILLKRR
jgi:hypothetical protein